MNSYFYLDAQNKNCGPVPLDRLAAEGVTLNTMVWCNGMADWQRAGNVPEVRDWFAAHAPQPPQYDRQSTASESDHAQSAGQGVQPPYVSPNGGAGYVPCPSTYLGWAIFLTICCCLPFGIVAIVKACRVENLYKLGHYDESLIASDEAKKWCLISLISGLVLNALCFGINFLVPGMMLFYDL